jgi:2C-methyl-D-erythritol 2,4-cyclodiphosphate synthase
MDNINKQSQIEYKRLLDSYIEKFNDQQAKIVELKLTILDLNNKLDSSAKQSIKNDLINILGAQANEITDSAINDIVNYILEREIKCLKKNSY